MYLNKSFTNSKDKKSLIIFGNLLEISAGGAPRPPKYLPNKISERENSLSTNTATSSNEDCDRDTKQHNNQNQHQVTFDSVEQLAIFDSSNGSRKVTTAYTASTTSPTKEGINGFFLSNTFSRK